MKTSSTITTGMVASLLAVAFIVGPSVAFAADVKKCTGTLQKYKTTTSKRTQALAKRDSAVTKYQSLLEIKRKYHEEEVPTSLESTRVLVENLGDSIAETLGTTWDAATINIEVIESTAAADGHAYIDTNATRDAAGAINNTPSATASGFLAAPLTLSKKGKMKMDDMFGTSKVEDYLRAIHGDERTEGLSPSEVKAIKADQNRDLAKLNGFTVKLYSVYVKLQSDYLKKRDALWSEKLTATKKLKGRYAQKIVDASNALKDLNITIFGETLEAATAAISPATVGVIDQDMSKDNPVGTITATSVTPIFAWTDNHAYVATKLTLSTKKTVLAAIDVTLNKFADSLAKAGCDF